MAIRFHCPACGKPIEVDDSDAGCKIACCYCRQAVDAPSNSDVNLQRAGDSRGAELSHISELNDGGSKPRSRRSAARSPVLGIIGLIMVFAAIAVMAVMTVKMMAVFAPMLKSNEFAQLSELEQRELLTQEMTVRMQQPRNLQLAAVMFFMLFAGLLVSLVAIVRNNGRRFGIVGLIISGSLLGAGVLLQITGFGATLSMQ